MKKATLAQVQAMLEVVRLQATSDTALEAAKLTAATSKVNSRDAARLRLGAFDKVTEAEQTAEAIHIMGIAKSELKLVGAKSDWNKADAGDYGTLGNALRYVQAECVEAREKATYAALSVAHKAAADEAVALEAASAIVLSILTSLAEIDDASIVAVESGIAGIKAARSIVAKAA